MTPEIKWSQNFYSTWQSWSQSNFLKKTIFGVYSSPKIFFDLSFLSYKGVQKMAAEFKFGQKMAVLLKFGQKSAILFFYYLGFFYLCFLYSWYFFGDLVKDTICSLSFVCIFGMRAAEAVSSAIIGVRGVARVKTLAAHRLNRPIKTTDHLLTVIWIFYG